MSAPTRGGGGLSLTGAVPGLSTWPSIVVLGLLLAWLEPARCAAQAPSGGSPGAAPPISATPPASQPATTGSLPSPVQTPGSPAMPGASGARPVPGSLEGTPSDRGANLMESPGFPTPMPRRDTLEQPQYAASLEPAVGGLPALSHDHRGDGAGTVGSFLIWQGQLPTDHGHYADGGGEVGGPIGPIGHLNTVVPLSHSVLVDGTLGYGPPGLHPGFYGFSLGYHPGYGYGGNALGVGTAGGYPCYGGPGYAFRYGYPKFAYPFYEGIGQLYFDPPVVISDLANPGDFGPYTGASAYAYTHPTYTAEAAATGSFVPGVNRYPDTSATNALPEATFTPREGEQPGPGAMNRVPAQDRYLGMDLQPATDPGGRRGLKIVNILPSSTAERAGLNVGDIIYSANGHVTDQGGHLGWIIANAAPDNVLTVTVRKASDGKEQTIRIEMP